MQFSHENSLADYLPLRVAIISPDGRDGMIKHARDCAEQGVPFIFDPGQQLPMFSGEELLTFLDQASYLACNDYEFEMVMDRTGLALQDIASRLDALVVTRGEHGSDIYAGGEHHKIPAVTAEPAWSTRPAAATPTAPACCTASRTASTGRPPAAWPACWAPSRSPTRAARTTASRPRRSRRSSKRRSATASDRGRDGSWEP
jgi:hypothetical protein